MFGASVTEAVVPTLTVRLAAMEFISSCSTMMRLSVRRRASVEHGDATCRREHEFEGRGSNETTVA